MTTSPSSRYVSRPHAHHAHARHVPAKQRAVCRVFIANNKMLTRRETQTRGLEAFGRKVTTTANHLIAPNADATGAHYQSALAEVQKQLKRPTVQRSVWSMSRTTPTEMVRSKLSKSEIQHRALTHLSDELLTNIPEHDNPYSLFQGFQASFPELTDEGKKFRRRVSRGRKMLDDGPSTPVGTPAQLAQLKKDKAAMMHEFDLLGVRKNMASSEIHEIDNKIANLHGMRRIILERLAGLEQEEALLEHDRRSFAALPLLLESHGHAVMLTWHSYRCRG